MQPLIAVLGKLGFNTPFLLWALRCEHWDLRKAAAQALSATATAQEVGSLSAALNDSHPEVSTAAVAALKQIEARVGRLRISLPEQQKMKYFLSQLAAVNVAQWVQLNGGRYGPLSPGDDSLMERIFSDIDQVVLFLIQVEPTLNIRWGFTDEVVFVEYLALPSRQLNQRRVILKRDETDDYLCYLAWALVY